MKAVDIHDTPGIHTGERIHLFETVEEAEQVAKDLLKICARKKRASEHGNKQEK